MSGVLRWVTWGSETGGHWHLRFGSTGATLCDRYPTTPTRTRWLADGAPADRCAKCAEVIAYRLGLPR